MPLQTRIADTRSGTGGYTGTLAANTWQPYQVAGVGGIIPATGVASVVVAVTALSPTAPGNIHLAPNTSRPAVPLVPAGRRYQDMILRFTTDLTIPWTNNQAERDLRPIKIQQRTSGGCWRTLTGLTEFATVHSYLATATKWGKNKLDALTELFTTGPWLPPALTPS